MVLSFSEITVDQFNSNTTFQDTLKQGIATAAKVDVSKVAVTSSATKPLSSRRLLACYVTTTVNTESAAEATTVATSLNANIVQAVSSAGLPTPYVEKAAAPSFTGGANQLAPATHLLAVLTCASAVLSVRR
jgi:hypothetical protein